MASDRKFAAKFLAKLEPLDVDARPMFGEFGLFYKGKMVGLICDNTFFIRVTKSGLEIAGRIAKGFPYPGAKAAFKISAAKMDDFDWLRANISITMSPSFRRSRPWSTNTQVN